MKLKIRRLVMSMIIAIIVFAIVFVGCGNESETFVEPTETIKIEVEYGVDETIENAEAEETTEPMETAVVEEVVEETKPKEVMEKPKQEQSNKDGFNKNTDKLKQEESKAFFYLSDYERKVVERIVMGEAGGEPYEGQVLVAQCILNACLKDDIQPSKVRTKYQYSGWNKNPSNSVKEAVSAVFDDGYKITNEPILYFYSPKYCKSSWHESQCFVIELGGHRFFAEWND